MDLHFTFNQTNFVATNRFWLFDQNIKGILWYVQSAMETDK